MRSLLVVFSYHHHNTEKIARVISEVLDADIKAPHEVIPEDLHDYDLVGFGSGIYSGSHHESLLSLADRLPPVLSGNAFLFSTAAVTSASKIISDHAKLREKLEMKGYRIIGDFSCKGYNTNSFLKYIGGMNKGRPHGEDLRNAEAFARDMKEISVTDSFRRGIF